MIASTFYAVAGEMEGRPVIEETGVCSNDGATLSSLRLYETERVQLNALPRRSGLTAKALDGRGAPLTRNISDPHLGRFENCMQIGRTKTRFFAPAQPFGEFRGKQLLTYSRTWVQLQG